MFKCCWNIYRNSPCSSGVYPNRKYTLLATQSTLEPNALSSNYSSVEFVVFLQVFNRHRLVPNSEAKRRGIEKRNSRPFHLTNETENTSFDSILVRDRKVFSSASLEGQTGQIGQTGRPGNLSASVRGEKGMCKILDITIFILDPIVMSYCIESASRNEKIDPSLKRKCLFVDVLHFACTKYHMTWKLTMHHKDEQTAISF